jgi:hypothetical protein
MFINYELDAYNGLYSYIQFGYPTYNDFFLEHYVIKFYEELCNLYLKIIINYRYCSTEIYIIVACYLDRSYIILASHCIIMRTQFYNQFPQTSWISYKYVLYVLYIITLFNDFD